MFLHKPFLPSILLLGLLLVASCQVNISADDESLPPPPITDFEKGIFIANNGNPQDGTSGSISFYERIGDQVENDIFQKANNNRLLGSNVRQVRVWNGFAYILVEDANKLEIVRAQNFVTQGAVGSFERPRFFLPIDDQKAYISQWGANGLTGSVEVFDLGRRTVVKSIPTRGGAGQMVRQGNFVYLVNDGGIQLDSVISKINVQEDKVVKVIDVGVAPQSLQLDQNGHLWVLSRGVQDQVNPDNDRPGRLIRLVDDVVQTDIELGKGAADLVANQPGDQLYFRNEGWIYRLGLTDNRLPDVPFLARAFTSLAVDPWSNHLVVADPANFQRPGDVLIFDQNGREISKFQVGVFPLYFWFE